MQRACAALGLLVSLLAAGTTHGEGPRDGCVVVTGASGFLAGHVINELLEHGEFAVHARALGRAGGRERLY
jgi:hypothetical protein